MQIKHIYKHILLTAILLATAPILWAQDGSAAYSFLNVTSSSKIYGLGGVNISLVDDDITVADQNPALLGSEMSNQVALNYMHYMGGSNFAGLRYGHQAGERGAWSAAIRYFGYGSIKEALPDGSIIGSDRDLSLSAVVANLGGQVKRFNEAYNRLPIDVRLGWSQSFGSFPIRFSITAWNLTKWHLPYVETGDGSDTAKPEVKDKFMSNLFRHLVFGADLISSDNFYIALGYNYKTRTDMSTYSRSFVSGFSLGAGLNVKSFRVGVALSQPHSGAFTMMVNLTCNLNELIN